MTILDNKLFAELKNHGVDVEGTLSRFVDNDELYMKFLLRYPDEDRLTPIKNAIAAKDYEALLSAAHKLKGVSANLGMTDLAAKAAKIVTKVREEQYEGFEADFAEAEKEYNIICGIISGYKK
ncbi:MAG: Hpt domain-containing protein [Oscillospiraceae bacterium]|nr:Hpt domain-containing protein [Oscillospiraceae bacterium]